jgi:pumilio RNA-binding family
MKGNAIILENWLMFCSFCPLTEMVKDQYANYVVQKVLGTVHDYDREKIIETIRLRVPGIRKIAYGRHICARIEKLTGRVI